MIYVLIYTDDNEPKPLKYCADKNKLVAFRAKLLKDAEGANDRNYDLADEYENQCKDSYKVRFEIAKEYFKRNAHAFLPGSQEKYQKQYKQSSHFKCRDFPTLELYLADYVAEYYQEVLFKYEKYFDMRYLHERLKFPKAPQEKQPNYEEEYTDDNLIIHEVEELV